MNIPQFTAQSSLYRSSNRYRSLGQRDELQTTVVIPQLPQKDAPGPGGCISDCMDKYPPTRSREQLREQREQCRRECFGGGAVTYPSVTSGYGPYCESSPPAACYLELASCCVFLPFGAILCLPICYDFYKICLEDSRRECLIARHGPLIGGSSYPRSGGYMWM
jgi:hypothetical protein